MYAGTGFWDTFRALYPLLNLLYPSVNEEMQAGLVNDYLEGGFLPEWSSPGFADVMIGNNCVMAQMGETKGAYISYHTFNVMLTTNPGFCHETDLWLKNLIRKSNLISGVAEKQRYRFFKRVDESLKKLVNKIEND